MCYTSQRLRKYTIALYIRCSWASWAPALNTTSHLRESNDKVCSSHNFRRGTNLMCTLPFPFGTIFRLSPRELSREISITAVTSARLLERRQFSHACRYAIFHRARFDGLHDRRSMGSSRLVSAQPRRNSTGRSADGENGGGKLITYNRSRTSTRRPRLPSSPHGGRGRGKRGGDRSFRGVRGGIYRIAGIIFQKESRRGQTLSW